jgi:hypothetical protein
LIVPCCAVAKVETHTRSARVATARMRPHAGPTLWRRTAPTPNPNTTPLTALCGSNSASFSGRLPNRKRNFPVLHLAFVCRSTKRSSTLAQQALASSTHLIQVLTVPAGCSSCFGHGGRARSLSRPAVACHPGQVQALCANLARDVHADRATCHIRVLTCI